MTEELEPMAAEYALGTLDAAERDVAARMRAADPAFDRRVTEWERRLSPLFVDTVSVTPSPGTWDAISHRLPRPTGRDPDGDVGVLRRSVGRWRAATLSVGALAAALAVFVTDRDLLRGSPVQPTGAYLAAVNRGGDLPALIVRVDLATHSVTVRPVEADTPAGRSLELWYIAAGAAPKSMGLVGNARAQMPMPSDMAVTNASFAVTVEPVGGSPTGAPTGPIVYKGALVAE